MRQTQSAPVLAELRQKLLAWKEQLLPKHPTAEAVNCTLSQWEELTVLQPSRRTDGSDPGQPDQQLPPARDGSATLLHATADESSLVAGK